MSKDLTNSAVDRQNILNNPYALAEIEKAAGIRGIPFEGKTVVVKEQVAAFFEVTLRTVENYLEQNAEELARNGYEVITSNRLISLKLAIQGLDDPETDFGMIARTARLGVLDFLVFLNLARIYSQKPTALEALKKSLLHQAFTGGIQPAIIHEHTTHQKKARTPAYPKEPPESAGKPGRPSEQNPRADFFPRATKSLLAKIHSPPATSFTPWMAECRTIYLS